MNTFSHVPPGFRFHPTDEELVDYYLRKKIASKIDLDVIKDVDLYKIEPWDLQELCKIGNEEQSEWYFFSHKDKKYPTGTRTNRATKAGFWKATGRDKAIYSRHCLIGMRKTLVFYKGRAPNGLKSDWIMHEYRLESNENATPQEEGWVVCRVFKKRMAAVRKMDDSPNCWYDDQVCFLESPRPNSNNTIAYASSNNYHHHPCKQELEHLQYNNMININHDAAAAALFLQLPQLESPKVPPHQSVPYNGYDNSSSNKSASVVLHSSSSLSTQEAADLHLLYCGGTNNNNINNDEQQQQQQQVTDWRVLDKFVASQLSHDQHNSKETTTNYSSPNNINNVAQHIAMLANGSSKEFDASTSTSSSHIDLWK